MPMLVLAAALGDDLPSPLHGELACLAFSRGDLGSWLPRLLAGPLQGLGDSLERQV
jgi:hypothetical protein